MSRSSKANRSAKRSRRRARRDLAAETTTTHQRTTLDEKLLGGVLPVIATNETLDAPGVRHDDDTRLATGITVKQLVQQAEFWWMRKGRKRISMARRSQVKQVRGMRTKRGPFTLDPDDPNFLPSGIMHGVRWDSLSRTEKLAVCKAYHEVRYSKPWRQIEGRLILPSGPIH